MVEDIPIADTYYEDESEEDAAEADSMADAAAQDKVLLEGASEPDVLGSEVTGGSEAAMSLVDLELPEEASSKATGRAVERGRAKKGKSKRMTKTKGQAEVASLQAEGKAIKKGNLKGQAEGVSSDAKGEAAKIGKAQVSGKVKGHAVKRQKARAEEGASKEQRTITYGLIEDWEDEPIEE